MNSRVLPVRLCVAVGLALTCVVGLRAMALPQNPPTPQAGPRIFDTMEYRIRVVTVADGLSLPYSLAFMPDGTALVTQLDGTIRVIRNGVLIPAPLGPIPGIHANAVPGPPAEGLMDIVAHPRFAANRLVYLTYSKAMEGGHTIALARGTFNGSDLVDVKEIFVTNAVSTQNGNPHTRIAFDREGLLYLAVSHHNQDRYAQDLNSHGGKVLRLRDDGTPAPGNPFLGMADRRPEVFTYGHRALHGIAVHPDTGEVWVNEHGDEVNILKPGGNFGWPFVGLMGLGAGNPTPPAPRGLTLTEPYISWVPALNISGMMFYTGDRFPKWKGNLIVGGLASGQVHRVAFRTTPKADEAMFTQMREALFTGIGQRVRDVRQGPDGLIYFVAYDDKSGTVRRIEPAS
jgi:glucose/arabinose dehydrogenase